MLAARRYHLCGAAAGAALGYYSGRPSCAEGQPKTAFGAFAQPTFAQSSSKVSKLASFAKLAPTPAPPMVIISPTFFPSVDDVRCQLGLQACRRAKSLGIPLLLVDASPPSVRAALEEAGAIVRPQTRAGRKGAALRECVEAALEQFQLPPGGVLCYQELEKVEMVPLQAEVAAYVSRSGADVCVPRRADGLFKSTYPVEQYHSEHFANLYLDTLGDAVGLPPLDWTCAAAPSNPPHALQARPAHRPAPTRPSHRRCPVRSRPRRFGPVAFRASSAHHWLQCEGELWDAQIVPFVRAARWHGARVEAFEVAYSHPLMMRREEEGKPVWSEKRLMQLNFRAPRALTSRPGEHALTPARACRSLRQGGWRVEGGRAALGHGSERA